MFRSDLVKAALDAKKAEGITQEEIAKATGLTQGMISALKTGKKKLSAQKSKVLFDYLGLKIGVVYGDNEVIDERNIVDISKKIPLISYVQAGFWMEVCDTFSPGDADEWVPISKRVGDHAFALRITGDSMEPSFCGGDIIVVDPDSAVSSGDYVVAKIHNGEGHNGEATFKKYVIDGSRVILRALNPAYDPMDMTGKNFCIVGRVVSRITDF